MASPSSGAPFPGRGLGVQTYIVEEKGRWVVYLDVAMQNPTAKGSDATEPGNGEPGDDLHGNDFHVVRRRIRDYSSEAEARVAARFIGLGAGRELRTPPSGF